MRRSIACLFLTLLACGDDGGGTPTDAEPPPDAELIKGCEVLRDPIAEPGDPIDGHTWETFAEDWFATHCTRCHSSTLTGGERNGAPPGYDWDIEANVRDHLETIRIVVGVTMYMPFTPPDPTCEERRLLVEWIDAGAP